MKAILCTTEDEWDTLHSSICEYLNIPTEHTEIYAEKVQVNPSHGDGGKFIMPLVAGGKWKCDDVFGSDAVDYDPEWEFAPEE